MNITRFLAAACFVLFVGTAPTLAANINIDGLPAASSVAGADLYECEQSGTNRKCTPAQLSVYLNGLISGDCTVSGNLITCSKTGGVAFGALATVTPGAGVATALAADVGATGSFILNGSTPPAGDLAGTYPSPTVRGMHGLALSVPATAGGAITSNGTWTHTGAFSASGAISGPGTGLTGTAAGLTAGHVTTNANLTGDVTSSGNATTLSNSGATAGSYTSANITVDAKGRVTAAANGSGGGGSGVTSVSAGCGASTGGSPITTTGTVAGTMAIRAVTITTDTILAADCGGLVNYAASGAVAVSLPQATSSFGAGWFTQLCNKGSSNITITPTTSTIGGSSTFVVAGGTAGAPACLGIVSDGTNYQIIPSYPISASQLSIGTLAAARLPAGTTSTIASGTATLAVTAIAAGACGTAITVTAAGVATTDVVTAGFAADPTSTTGFLPTAMLTIVPFAASGSVGFRPCNLTSASITPSATTFNWRVTR